MYTVLLIEDDSKLCTLTKIHFEKHGFKVITIDDFQTVLSTFDRVHPELVILDINIPFNDGFYLCKSIRRRSRVPIIIISARDGLMDQVMGMELGADDYVVKPYKLEILLAKSTALLRRTYDDFGMKESKELRIGDFVLDSERFKMRYHQKEIELSKNELILLKIFMEQKDIVIQRDQLLLALWDDTTFVDDNTLTVNITRLKNKLSDFKLEDIIKTKRGIGYWLDASSLTGDAAAKSPKP